MRILPVSDIHAEFHADGGKAFAKFLSERGGEADVLVIAGDCGTTTLTREGEYNFEALLDMLCASFAHVVYTTGNHEYYGTKNVSLIHEVLAKFSEDHPNFHWLHRSTVEIDGQRFVGCTLWFKDDPMSMGVRGQLMDFSYIPGFNPWVFQENEKNVKFLRSTVRQGDVVITHHLPTFLSVTPDFKGSPLNAFYVCDMSKEIFRLRPSLWVHGHSHHSQDYLLGNTRIVANPFGYRYQGENPQFDPAKILEI
jgi:Icc-related predicted phosphoesterase